MTSPIALAVDTARHAGELLKERFAPFGIQATAKPDNTLVTQADLDSDALITREISAHFPTDLILSEEKNTSSGRRDQPIWIIDPLDGTTNFSLGLPIWGVSIARIVNGVPQTAVLNFPLLNELYLAERGTGAYLNDTKLPPQDQLHHGTSFFACCSRSVRNYDIDLPYKTRILGAATYNIASVARNTAIMSMEATPKIWDLAACWLIAEESGCRIDVLEEPSPFPLLEGFEYKSQSFPTLCAQNQQLFDKLRRSVKKKL